MVNTPANSGWAPQRGQRSRSARAITWRMRGGATGLRAACPSSAIGAHGSIAPGERSPPPQQVREPLDVAPDVEALEDERPARRAQPATQVRLAQQALERRGESLHVAGLHQQPRLS